VDRRKERKEKQCVVFAFKRGTEDNKSEEENGEDFSRKVTYSLKKFWTSKAVEKGNQRQLENKTERGNCDFDLVIRP
jgi:hypothetical protein